ncbi:M28 family metallopeptidase [Streptomyces marinisediminis]|uniref:M28 family metallopeptidase n=1 Tax=Streptomyces TaxID=1883 RepID=UPI003A4C7835
MSDSPRNRRRALAAFAAAAVAAPLLVTATAAPAAAQQDPAERGERLAKQLVRKTTGDGALRHMRVFQAIADLNDDNRAAGSRGYDMSAWYASALLRAAGYEVTQQEFAFTYRETVAESLTQLTPEQRDIPITLMTYTPSTAEGGVEAAVTEVPVDEDGTTGCTTDDYAAGDFTDRIALIQRGGCSFAEKQAAAAEAGALGALVYNNVEGDLNGTLGDPAAGRVPTGGLSQAAGEALSDAVAAGEVTVNLELIEFQEERTTSNVIAETRGGDEDNVVMVGAHLDSVPEGPGINDNASGSAGVLESALQYAWATKQWHPRGDHRAQPANKVRFALWGAEELGLLGAEHYVGALSEAERERIALYLNFDMIASPNYGLFVYDGDDSDGVGAGPGPEGSAQIEHGINEFIRSRGEEPRGTDFTGRSDYGPFIEVGIPSGGTFTGAEGVKTEQQVALWGGTAGESYDPCYHQACDDLDNVNEHALDVNVRVIADAVGRYAWDTSSLTAEVPSVPSGPGSDTDGGHDHDHGGVTE